MPNGMKGKWTMDCLESVFNLLQLVEKPLHTRNVAVYQEDR